MYLRRNCGNNSVVYLDRKCFDDTIILEFFVKGFYKPLKIEFSLDVGIMSLLYNNENHYIGRSIVTAAGYTGMNYYIYAATKILDIIAENAELVERLRDYDYGLIFISGGPMMREFEAIIEETFCMKLGNCDVDPDDFGEY